MKNKINEKIKKLRKQAHITQEKMGELLEMKRSTYAHTEAYGNFKPEHLRTIATTFGLTVDELVNAGHKSLTFYPVIQESNNEPLRLEEPKFEYKASNEDLESVITFKERQLINFYRKLKPENKEMMLKLIEELSTEE